MNKTAPFRRYLKTIAKTRAVDLRVGKRGVTNNFIVEVRRVLNRDGMVKLSLSSDKEIRSEQVDLVRNELHVTLVSSVGRTASFTSQYD